MSELRSSRRRHILDAALRTFLRDGYRGATMERVAEDVGVSKQTLYNYFGDKEELLASLLEAYRGGHASAEIESALNRLTGPDPEAALLEAAQALFANASQPEVATLHRILVEVAAELPEVMVRVRQRVFLQNVEMVSAALQRGIAAGALRAADAEAVAYFLFGIAASFGMFRPRQPDDLSRRLSPERMATALAGLLGHGLLAERHHGNLGSGTTEPV